MKSLSSDTGGRIEPFVYLDLSPGPHPDLPALPSPDSAHLPAPAGTVTEDEAQLREARARCEGRQEAEAGFGVEVEQRLGLEREAILVAVRSFDRQREAYFHQLEREVVQLVLGIARKVLQRESQLDPLFLAGTVKVALDQLGAGSKVDLFVPVSKMPLWEELLLRDAEMRCKPKLLSDPSLEPVGCRLETESGGTDLSLETQLREVEQGFLELLDRRSQAAPRLPSPDPSPRAPQTAELSKPQTAASIEAA